MFFHRLLVPFSQEKYLIMLMLKSEYARNFHNRLLQTNQQYGEEDTQNISDSMMVPT